MEFTIPDTGGHSAIFYASQSPMLIIGTDAPGYTMLDVNNAYLQATHTEREDLIGKSVFGVFPANPTDMVSKNIERTIYSFEQAIQSRLPHTMYNYRYDIPIPGTDAFEERWWTTSNTPVMDDTGKVIYFIHSPSNVTELYKLSQREQAGVEALKQQRLQLHATFMQAPVGIAILKGRDYVVELINPSLAELYGKSKEELLGRPIFEVLTHARGLGFEALLDNVRLTGESFKATGMAVPLLRNGAVELVHVNFVYEPFRESEGSVTGVIVIATEVTELARAKSQAEQAEARARLATGAVGLGTFDLDLHTGEMITSQKFAQIFGFDKPVSRETYIAVFHTDDLPARLAAHQQALETGTLSYEARVLWQDGSVHWVKVEGKVFYDQQKPERILGTLLDTTDTRKAREEQRKLISLVENSVDLVSILNLNGYNDYINAAGRELLGFESTEQVISTPVAQLHALEHLIQVEKEVIPSVMNTGHWSGTMIVRHLLTKENFPVLNNCFRIDDPITGQPLAIGAVMRDLRPEVAARKALADSEELLKNITAAAPIALWMSDENGSVTYVNQTWLNWTGQPLETQLGQGWIQHLAMDDRQSLQDTFAKSIRGRKYFRTEFQLHHADGTVHWCNASGHPQYDGKGIFTGYIGACVDITEQKFLQKQKDDFIGIASHELKTPVTTIKGYAQVLQKMLLKKGDLQEAQMMGRMDAQIKRLTSLIGDLLDVTKINSGKLDFNDAVFDFNAMVNELVEDLQRGSEKHQLIENLRATGLVFGDRDRISQVITNLVTNAIKYSPGANSIIIHTSVKDSEVHLCVEDHGIGIAREKQEKVFEQFYRVSGDMQHTFPGLGLGLYISSEIIKRERGRIWVTSEEGKGSTFCFSLPLYQSSNEQ